MSEDLNIFLAQGVYISSLRNDFQLPSIATLTRLTSKVSKMEDNNFLKNIFQSLNSGQRICILLIDEVYVKSMLICHGGQLFGSSVDNSHLAKTVLAVMVVVCMVIQIFSVKMLPVSKLDTNFLYDQSELLIKQIKGNGDKLVSIIYDNNRVNQAFFKRFSCVLP